MPRLPREAGRDEGWRLAAATQWRRGSRAATWRCCGCGGGGGGGAAKGSVFCLQCWENGIILCRELADQYESYYDYRNLSKMRVGFSNPVPLSLACHPSDIVLFNVCR